VNEYKISVIAGDGIGPELTEATMKVLDAARKKFKLSLSYVEAEAGDACYQKRGVALPEDSIEKIKVSHACLKGPVGETAADVIVKLRLMFDLYANLRPIKAYPAASAARPEIDMFFVRENTEDVYKGLEYAIGDTTLCLRVITKRSCERIAQKAFEIAEMRNMKRKVTAIHKANVMRVTDGLFARVCREVAQRHPKISFNELYVDAAAMRLIKEPQNFDVIVTTNMFGDILSDEAAQLVGGLGMAPGANIGDNFALFEPIHGSAPNRAGKQTANPCSMILAAKLMLEWLGNRYSDQKCMFAGKAIEDAVVKVLQERETVPDLGGKVTTLKMAEAIAEAISEPEAP
jgi:3-isopropylmalate dehydrogenase